MAAPKKNDLLIRGADGKLYYITEQELQQYALDDQAAAPLTQQISSDNAIVSTHDVATTDEEARASNGLAASMFVTARQPRKGAKLKVGKAVTYLNVGMFVTGRSRKK